MLHSTDERSKQDKKAREHHKYIWKRSLCDSVAPGSGESEQSRNLALMAVPQIYGYHADISISQSHNHTMLYEHAWIEACAVLPRFR